ncbi:unnamed protein product, partial [Ascophyllum nodosum]
MGKKSHGSGNPGAPRGSRSNATGKGHGNADASKDSIHKETLRMIQELGIPGAAAELHGSSANSSAVGSNDKAKNAKNRGKERLPTKATTRSGAPNHGNADAPPKRRKGETGGTNA